MSSPSLTPLLQQHFLAPTHVGRVALRSGVGRGENVACSDEVTIELEIRGGAIADVRWHGRGCSATIAASSFACSSVQGKALSDARAFDLLGALAEVGGLPPRSEHAGRLVARALEAALADYGRACHS